MRETLKRMTQGMTVGVFVAKDAEPRVIEEVVAQSKSRGVPVDYVDSMDELGRLCGIEVGAACAALLSETPPVK
jgi:large subunit ribosomal protein L7A